MPAGACGSSASSPIAPTSPTAQNNEFGFDYLRDNMKFRAGLQTSGRCNYAIIDEVDSILIDEARTPLIISGRAQRNPASKYRMVNEVIPKLLAARSTTIVDEKGHSVTLTDEGIGWTRSCAPRRLSEPATGGRRARRGCWATTSTTPSTSTAAAPCQPVRCKAHTLYKRDVNYVVRDGEVPDRHRRRVHRPCDAGRRWSDGLHQAVEAKEGAASSEENQTHGHHHVPELLPLYDKLAGMTGTADTEAAEFHEHLRPRRAS